MLAKTAHVGDPVTVAGHKARHGILLAHEGHTSTVRTSDGTEIMADDRDVYPREAGALLDRTIHDLARAHTHRAKEEILRKFRDDWKRATNNAR